MENLIEKLNFIMANMSDYEYILWAFIVITVLLLLAIFFVLKDKNKFKNIVEENLKCFKNTFELSDDAILILSNKNTILYANISMLKLLKIREYKNQILNPIPRVKIKKVWHSLDILIQDNAKRIDTKPLLFPNIVFQLLDEDEISINLNIDNIKLNKKDRYRFISIQNLTKHHIHARESFRHKLTGLPNQLQALKDLVSLYSKLHQNNNKTALVLMNLDNFARLRSIIGYDEANTILIKFSTYLKSIQDEYDMNVYHTYENYFLLTITNLKERGDAKNIVQKIQDEVKESYQLDNLNIHISLSAGISIYPDSGTSRKLLDNVYKALSQAQKYGDGQIHLYLPPKSKFEYDEVTLHNDMQGALDNKEFEVYYQPIVDASTKEVVSAEALIRWKHKDYGLIPPDAFISLMEQTGFIIKLGQYIIKSVFAQQKRWELFGFKKIQVSINVSMIEIATGDYVDFIEQNLKEFNLDPQSVKFEITEGRAMISEEDTRQYFVALKELGVSISLDDFGTGYTSFTYLKKFPADVLKIDKSLVDYILTNKEDQGIVKGIIKLGHNLGMKIVVEGIENVEMVNMLASFDCDYMQGYHFAKPLQVFEFQKLLRKEEIDESIFVDKDDKDVKDDFFLDLN